MIPVRGVYQLSVGPLNVKTYTQIKLDASVSSGSGIIKVQVLSSDSKGNCLGTLGEFTLDPGSPTGANATEVYNVPAQHVMVRFQAGSPDHVNLVVLGK